MEEIVEIILRAVDEASNIFSSVTDSATEMETTITSGASNASDSLGEVETGAEDAKESIDSMADLMAFQAISDVVNQLADELWDLADKAGTVQDSWTRVGLAAEGAGIPIDDMKNSISSLTAETGRAGGSIRESFINMSSAGVTELSAMETVFKGASAQAFILGTDVDSLVNKFSGMAMKSSIAERTLKGTGITVEELGQALGIQGATIDDVNSKWETMDTDARAAALGQAAAMNEGVSANEEYKTSWEGLQNQIEIAKGKLEVMLGNVLLPVLIPALQAAGDILNWFGNTLQWVMDSPLGGFVSVIGSAAAGLVLLLAGVTAVTAGMGFFTASLMPAIAASWALISPWLPFIAIGAAIVLIIYEIGKAFGWWSDASSMIEAIGAGLQRLWDAFINHPDVQAAISMLSSAMSTLWSWIQQAGQAIAEFFGISTGGDFDIIAMWINNIGLAWDTLKGIVMGVVDVFTQFQSGQLSLIDIIGMVAQGLTSGWLTIVSTIVSIVSGLAVQLWNYAVNAGRNFITGIVTYISLLPGRFLSYLARTRQYIITQLLLWVNVARDRARQILTNIVMFISQLPGRILTLLVNVGRTILTQGQQWIVNAKTKASGVVQGVIYWLATLPGKVLDALAGVVDSIISGAKDWYNTAKEQGKKILDGVKDGISGIGKSISSAMSGVKDAIVKPFSDAWSSVSSYAAKIRSVDTSHSGSGRGTFGYDLGYDVGGYENGSQYGKLDVNLHFTGLPSGMNATQLATLISNKGVIDALVNSQYYQSANRKATIRYNGKVARSG